MVRAVLNGGNSLPVDKQRNGVTHLQLQPHLRGLLILRLGDLIHDDAVGLLHPHRHLALFNQAD
ncbi:hypothetical protein D3C76_1777990 [compost metagenome]